MINHHHTMINLHKSELVYKKEVCYFFHLVLNFVFTDFPRGRMGSRQNITWKKMKNYRI